jgi:hypothetical protein
VAEDDLTTLTIFKEYAQIPSDDTAADDTINRLITWGSGLIRSYLQRSITMPPVTEQRVIYFNGERSKLLEDNAEDITQVIAPVGYLVEGEIYMPEEEIIDFEWEQSVAFTRIILPDQYVGPVYITATWGWETVPSDLEYAATLQVDEWFRGNVMAVYNPPDEGESRRREISGGLSDHVKEILEPWTFRTRVV